MSKELKILFAVDFKKGCEDAMKDLIALSSKTPMSLTLMSIYFERRFEEVDQLYAAAVLKHAEAKSKIQFAIEDKLETWAKTHTLGFKTQKLVDFGEPAEVFAKHAGDFDLIVLGSNKHGFIDKLFMNSVAETIIGRTFAPTLIKRSDFSKVSSAKVLVDLGDHPKEVIKNSIKWAKTLGLSSLEFCSYYPMALELTAIPGASMPQFPAEEMTLLMEQIKTGLTKMIHEESEGLDFKVEVKKVSASSLATDITNDLEDCTQPVFIGRKKRSKLSEFFLGSVAISLMRTLKTDLLILPISK